MTNQNVPPKDSTAMVKNSVLISVILLVASIVAGAVYVDSIGHDPTYLFTFALTMLPLLTTLIYQGYKNSQQNEGLSEQVNGKLTARLDAQTEDVKAHMSNMADEIAGKVMAQLNGADVEEDVTDGELETTDIAG